MIISITQDTWFKSQDKDSKELPQGSLTPLRSGNLDVESIHTWGNHYRATIKGKVGYIYSGHCKIVSLVLPYFDAKNNTLSIKKACDSFGLTLDTQKAYVLATIKHETGGTLKPIEEYYGRQQAIKLKYDGGAEFFG
jgi:hypothetical protein